jgi:predicted RNase H-like HicB family nuclease
LSIVDRIVEIFCNHWLQKIMKIRAIVHPAEEGGYWAEVPALPGCVTEGETMEEVMANLKDAIEGWLEVEKRRSGVEAVNQIYWSAFQS